MTVDTVIATVDVGFLAQGVDITPAGTKVNVVNQGDDNISVIDPSTNTVVDTIDTGDQPMAFGVFIGLEPPSDINLSQEFAINRVGTTHIVTATLESDGIPEK